MKLVFPRLRVAVLAAFEQSDGSLSAAQYAELLKRDIADWGVVTTHATEDNTVVMPAAAKLAGLTVVPCISHVLSLASWQILQAFAMSALVTKIGAVFTSASRGRLLRALGIDSAAFKCPEHRFTIYERATSMLAEGEKVRDAVLALITDMRVRLTKVQRDGPCSMTRACAPTSRSCSSSRAAWPR